MNQEDSREQHHTVTPYHCWQRRMGSLEKCQQLCECGGM